MAKNLPTICVFVASPSDCTSERKCARELIGEVNENVARPLGLRLESYGWEDENPQPGRPQDVINQELDAADWAVFILRERFGTPTGGFGSGFEEEFERARASYAANGSPKIALFFRALPDAPSVEADQWDANLAFRDRVFSAQEFLVGVFEDEKDLEATMRKTFSHWLINGDFVVEPEKIGIESQPLQPSASTVAAIALSRRLLDEGRPASAEQTLRKHLANAPEDPDAWDQLALVLTEQGQNREALAALNRAIELAPRVPRHRFNRGLVNSRLEDRESAIRDFLEVVKLDSKSSDAIGNIGIMYSQMGQNDLAVEWLTKAIELDGRHVNNLRARGLAFEWAGQFESALQDYDRALAIKDEARLHVDRSRVMRHLGKWDLALAELDLAEAELGSTAEYVIHRIALLRDAGRLDDAFREASDGVDRFPDDTDLLRMRGVLSFYSGRLSESASDLRTVATATERDEDWLNLACSEIVRGDSNSAVAAVARAKVAKLKVEHAMSITWFEAAAAALAGRELSAKQALEALAESLDGEVAINREYSDMYSSLEQRVPAPLSRLLKLAGNVLCGLAEPERLRRALGK